MNIVDGRVLMEKRQVKALNVGHMLTKVQEIASRLVRD
jgi:hypothetical protein